MSQPAPSDGDRAPAEDGHPDGPALAISFWRQPRVQQVLPFVTSIFFHGALIVLGLLLYKAVVIITAEKREQIIIPDTNLVADADNGGVPNPGINNDPTRAAAQNSDDTVTDAKDWADKKSPTLSQNLMSGSADVASDVTPIGAGATTGGSVTGLNTKGVGESGGNLAPFGPPGGGAGQGKGLFGIPGGNVKRVAYVCDASGSLFGTRALALIKSELRESIGRLKPSQSFNLLFFRGSESPPVVLGDAKGVLQTVNEKNKSAAYDMIENLEVKGQTDPRPALDLAFKMQPQPEMVFLLIDGVESNVMSPEDLQKHVAGLNAAKKVKLQVIVVGDASELDLKPFNDLSVANGGGPVRRVTEK